MMRLAVIVVALAGAYLLRPEPEVDARARSALARDAGGAAARLALEAFRPLYVQHLWWRLDHARSEDRLVDVLATLELLARAEPAEVRATVFLSLTLTQDLAPRESSKATRLSRWLEAARLLAEARTRHDGNARLHQATCALLGALAVTTDFDLQRAFRNAFGAGPTELAVAAGRRGLVLRPDSRALAVAHAVAATQRGVEVAIGDPEPDPGTARELLTEARVALARSGVPLEASISERTRAWERLFAAWIAGDANQLARAIEALTAAIGKLAAPPLGQRDLEAARLELISLALMDLSSQLSSGGEPRAVLSALLALNTMRTRYREWREGEAPSDDAADPLLPRLREAVRELLDREPGLTDQVPAVLR